MNKGRLVLWNDDKGFGFVRPEMGEKDYFVHISAFRKGMSRRPEVGDVILFEPDRKSPAQRRIVQAEIEGMPYAQPVETADRRIPSELAFWVKVIFSIPFLCSMFLAWRARNPLPFMSYTLMSIIAVLLYGLDKKQSLQAKQRWRIPEIYLHVVELLGGWPGALMAQTELRHKVKKAAYQRIYWTIVTFHLLGWSVYLYLNWARLNPS